MSDLLLFLYSDEGLFQHGYRKGKGVYTAMINVIEKLKENKEAEVLEFDFKSFFNKVSLN
jgi:hypothetical protein